MRYLNISAYHTDKHSNASGKDADSQATEIDVPPRKTTHKTTHEAVVRTFLSHFSA